MGGGGIGVKTDQSLGLGFVLICGVCVVDGWFTASPGLSQTA